MNNQRFTLDISKEPDIAPVLYLGQGDKNGTTLEVEITDNGTAFALDNYTVSFAMRLPGEMDYYEVNGEAVGNVATFAIDETYAASKVGETDTAYVRIKQGGSVIASTKRMGVVILPSAEEGVIPAPAYESRIDQFIEEAREEIEEIVGGAVPTMSATQKGGAKLGSGLTMSGEVLSVDPSTIVLPTATLSSLGVVKPDGTTTTVDADGTLHSQSVYDLPKASASTLGGVRVGNNLSIDGDGVLNAAGGGGGSYYGTCATAGDVAVKEVSLPGFELVDGAHIVVKFTYANTITSAALYLNVNSSGNKVVTVRGHYAQSDYQLNWESGACLEFMYAHGDWCYTGSASSSRDFGSLFVCTTAAATGDKVINSTVVEGRYALTPFSRVYIRFTKANTADVLTFALDGLTAKPIYLNGAATSASNKLTWSAWDVLEFFYDGSYWHYLGKANELKASQSDLDTAEDAITDITADIGDTSLLSTGTICGDVDALRDSVSSYGVVYQTTNMGDITLNSQGYYTIPEARRPSGTVVAALIAGWSTMYPIGAINITSDGIYIMGAANTNITNLRISYLIRP